MTTTEPDRQPRRSLMLAVADGFTSVVLLLVLAALAWMALADTLPASWRLASLEVEIVVVLGLLTAALLAVSGLALLHTRDEFGS